jgi:hypothetical protein
MERSRIYGAFERVSRKWWFYVLVVMALGIPPYASTGVAPEQIASLVQEVLSQGLTAYSALMPMLHIAVAALVVLVGIYGNRVGRLFSAFMGLHYIFIAIAQNTAVTPTFGYAVISSNVLLFMVIGIMWLWDAAIGKTDYTLRGPHPWWTYWVLPLAVLAFWGPDVPWSFHLRYLVTSSSVGAFCLMTPIYLSVLNFCPRHNLPAVRLTSFVGILMAIFNFMIGLSLCIGGNAGLGIYQVFIHLPLAALSTYSFISSFRAGRARQPCS